MYRALVVLLFLLSIVAANVAVSELRPVHVGFGLIAPAGVYFVALTLALRDLVQRFSGPLGLCVAGVGGVALSFVLADSQVVWASVAAFVVSFLIDTLIFTLVWNRWSEWRYDLSRSTVMVCAVLFSGLISLVPDTLVFLYLSGLEQFIPGQLLGKTYGTLIYAAGLWVAGDQPRDQRPCYDADGYCLTHHTHDCYS